MKGIYLIIIAMSYFWCIVWVSVVVSSVGDYCVGDCLCRKLFVPETRCSVFEFRYKVMTYCVAKCRIFINENMFVL